MQRFLHLPRLLLPACLSLPILFPASPVGAQPEFSLDAASPSVPTVGSADVLVAGGSGGPPVVANAAADLGLAASDELDAMTGASSLGAGSPPLGLLHFSVDRASAGVPVSPLDVADSASLGQAAGDIYISALYGLDTLAYDQEGLGLVPALPAGDAATPPIDDVDAIHLIQGAPPLFSLANGHAYTGSGTGCGGDVFAAGPSLAHGFAALGLSSCDDDVDALHLYGPSGALYFSLAPGSPSLAPGSPIAGCAAGCSAADLFVADTGLGQASLYATAAGLGLLPGDDVDAIGWPHCPDPSGVDDDGDGVDDNCDNCLLFANPRQNDTDADGVGNLCDADFDQDATTGLLDFNRFREVFETAIGDPDYLPAADFNGDGVIGLPDWNQYRVFFPLGINPDMTAFECFLSVPCTLP